MDEGRVVVLKTVATAEDLSVGSKWLGWAFWFGVLVVTPLAIDPTVMLSTSKMDGAIVYSRLLLPRLWVLLATVLLGLLSIGMGWRAVRRSWAESSTPYKVLFLAGCLLPLASALWPVLSDRFEEWQWLGHILRLDGALVQAVWLLLLPIGTLLGRSPWLTSRGMLQMVLCGQFVIAVWILLQEAGLPLALLGGSTTVGAAFGHRAISTAFLALSLVILVSLLPSRLRRPWTLWFLLVGIVIALNGGRAGAVAAVAGLGLIAVAWWRSAHRGRSLRYVLATILGFTMGSFFWPDTVVTVGDAAASQDLSFSIRTKVLWPVGLKALVVRPLTGLGTDGFDSFVWNADHGELPLLLAQMSGAGREAEIELTGTPLVYYRQPGEETYTTLIAHYDKAHNYFLDIGIIFGLPALAILLGWLVILGVYIHRNRSRFALAAGALMVTYLTFGQAWFPNIWLDPYVWGGVGALIGLSAETSRASGLV